MQRNASSNIENYNIENINIDSDLYIYDMIYYII